MLDYTLNGYDGEGRTYAPTAGNAVCNIDNAMESRIGVGASDRSGIELRETMLQSVETQQSGDDINTSDTCIEA